MNNAHEQLQLVYVTCPDDTIARRIATRPVEERSAACVNIVPALESVYRWQGEVETASESLLIIKTRKTCLQRIQACLDEVHPDELPELVAVPIQGGTTRYLDWVLHETS